MPSIRLTLSTPREMASSLADRLRGLRLAHNWTRATLAERAGVSAASLKRFETTGQASLDLVLRVSHALSRLPEFGGLFAPPEAATLEELEKRMIPSVRKRGRL